MIVKLIHTVAIQGRNPVIINVHVYGQCRKRSATEPDNIFKLFMIANKDKPRAAAKAFVFNSCQGLKATLPHERHVQNKTSKLTARTGKNKS